MIVDQQEMADLIREAKTSGASPRLVEVVRQIALLVWGRYQWSLLKQADYVQDCFVLFLRHLPRIDPDRRPFAFLYLIFRNLGIYLSRTEGNRLKLFGEYAEAVTR